MKTKLVSTSLFISLALLLICSGYALTYPSSIRSLSDKECSLLYAGNDGCSHKCEDKGNCRSNYVKCSDYNYKKKECLSRTKEINQNNYKDYSCEFYPDEGECETYVNKLCRKDWKCEWAWVTQMCWYNWQDDPDNTENGDTECDDQYGGHT